MYQIFLSIRYLAVFALLLFGPVGQASAESGSGDFSRNVAGSYLITHDTSGSRDVLTVNTDGTFLMASSDSFAFQFTNSQGAWERTGRRTIAAKVVNFDHDDNGVGIVRFSIEFDRRFKKIAGEFTGAVIDAEDPDPLAEKSVLFTFSDSFTGRRITAD